MGASNAIGKTTIGSSVPMQVKRIQNGLYVRWYVLTLPAGHRGCVKGLQSECDRRKRNNEPSLEFFAPTYVEVEKKDGAWIKTERPLLYNYVFLRASEEEIYRMMRQRLSLLSFLPRVRTGNDEYYPYIADEAMRNLQWVARSYSDVVPVCAPEPGQLMKGDRVRITEGKFKNVEASVIIQPGVGQKDIMVCIEDWMWVPLLHVQPGQYEVISLNTESMHLYSRLNNDRLFASLHKALGHFYSSTGATADDMALANETKLQYGSLKMDSDVTRCKLYALLLPAYTILSDHEACERTIGMMQTMLVLSKAEQARALLLVTLYGCTDNSIYYQQAHAIVDTWRAEAAPKKSKQQLIQRLDDYDLWLGHKQ